MTENCKELWVDKYRPGKLDDYIINADLRDYFSNMIKSKTLQNMTFAGICGMGKTSLAKILAKEFDAQVLFVKCATEGTVDVLRTKVQEFCNAMSFDGKVKIVILDECDSASSTGQNNFQLALRTLIEAAQDDTRFLITCNTVGKIVPAILSRCPVIPLKFDKKDLLLHVKKILDNEKIKYTKESLKNFIEESFSYYPDCRRIINYLQFCCGSGELVVKIREISSSENDGVIETVASKALSEKNLLEVRRLYLQSKDKIGDYVEAASKLLNYAVDNDLLTSEGVLKIIDLIYQLNVVVDKEPTFFGIVVALSTYRK